MITFLTKKLATNNSILVILFFSLFAIAYSFLDPDFLWHLRNGSEILNGQFNLVDQYSYTMPSFHFVNHSWLVSVIFAFIYKNIQLAYFGVALFCALIATIGAHTASNGIYWLVPLVAESYLYGFGVRSHIATFLLLIITLKVIQNYTLGIKNRLYLIPLIMFLWANLHGGFVIGLIYLWGFYLIDVIILRKKISHSRVNVFLLFVFSTSCTFLTPYTYGTWQEALRTVGNPLLTKYISEWQPMTVYASFGFFMIVVLLLLSIWYQKSIRWIHLFIALLFIDSLVSVRMVPLFCASSCFVIVEAYNQFLKKNHKIISYERLAIATKMFTILALGIFLVDFVINLRARLLVTSNIYPVKAVEYLQQHNPNGQIFSIIHWNNYLLWKIPDRREFIDGRMMVWIQSEKNNELSNAFLTYLNLTLGKESLSPVLDKFCISTVLWTNYNLNDDWVRMIAPINLTNQLNKNEWRITYSDYNSVIYERPLPNNCKAS